MPLLVFLLGGGALAWWLFGSASSTPAPQSSPYAPAPSPYSPSAPAVTVTPPGPYSGSWGPSGPPPPGTSQADIQSFLQAAAQYQQQLAAAPADATYGNGLPLQPLAPWAPIGTTSD